MHLLEKSMTRGHSWAAEAWNATSTTLRVVMQWMAMEPDVRRKCPYYKYAEEHPEIVKLDASVKRLAELQRRLIRNGQKKPELKQNIRKLKKRWIPTLGVDTVILFNAGFVAYLLYHSTIIYEAKMLTPSMMRRLRTCLCVVGSTVNILFALLLVRKTVAHTDICWWLFALETIGLSYYVIVEFWLGCLEEGRLSLLGIFGSAVATQGVLSNSVEPMVSQLLMLLAGCNLGLVFSIGLRIRPQRPTESRNNLTRDKLDVHNGVVSEITPETSGVAVVQQLEWTGQSDSESESMSNVSSPVSCCLSRDLLTLTMGIFALLMGVIGWVLNFSGWFKECLDKNTCSDLAPQWWTLGQSLMFFMIYVISVSLSRTFEVMAAYSVLVSIPLSVLIRVANAARSDFFYLKNQEDAHETSDSPGTVIGSSLIVASGILLVASLGVQHFAWKSPAPERSRSFRATLSLFGLLGIVIFGVGLQASQIEACDHTGPLCDWYDGLWVDVALEVLIVLLGVLSVFSQPGESIRATFVALTVLPSYAYFVNISRFLEHWNSAMNGPESTWEIRFAACGLIMLTIFNYMWMFAWGWGRSEAPEHSGHHTLPRSINSVV